MNLRQYTSVCTHRKRPTLDAPLGTEVCSEVKTNIKQRVVYIKFYYLHRIHV